MLRLAQGGSGPAERVACWDPIDVNDAFPSTAGEYNDWQARRAAAGMYGGTFLVLQCVERCRGNYAATVGWAWRNPREADEFAAAVPRFLAAVLGARRAGRSTWSFDGGAAAVAVEGCITGLAFAPSGFLAARLARAPIDRPAIPPRPCQAAP